MENEYYISNNYKKYHISDDYGYWFEDTAQDKVAIAINEIITYKALPELYNKLSLEEKRKLMELILNDPNLL